MFVLEKAKVNDFCLSLKADDIEVCGGPISWRILFSLVYSEIKEILFS